MERPENAQIPLSVYNSLTEAQGGPPAGIRWFTHLPEPEQGAVLRTKRRLSALSIPTPEWTITNKDLDSTTLSRDKLGYPAVSFQLKPNRVIAFGDFTGAHVHEPMAIVLNDEIVSFAIIGEKLPGQAQIYGHFTDQNVAGMLDCLRSGELPSRPVLVSVEQIAAGD
jgi:preprotein translocase subunit SecD